MRGQNPSWTAAPSKANTHARYTQTNLPATEGFEELIGSVQHTLQHTLQMRHSRSEIELSNSRAEVEKLKTQLQMRKEQVVVLFSDVDRLSLSLKYSSLPV